ncbi:hypothetical protein SCHPADRAFT_893904 [Schizopora paradoxa]|uniref:BTB domain-containing protein n=1 Tax=Schizopora paradoxa TaxID=27342 RepID=A0A0H2R946_9AGAM|nr:hypothetical protein SCHPADRAFT_893904 [Schizopora paradoxa]
MLTSPLANSAPRKLSPARASGPTPNKKVWKSDGNIVLATDKHLYRVHKSVLSENSLVFRDMLDLASPDSDDGEKSPEGDGASENGPNSWEGLPVVRLRDKDEELEYLLRALYSRRFFRVHEQSTVPIVTGLLNLSNKYDVPDLRYDVVKHLQRYFPSTLEEYKLRDNHKIFAHFDDADLHRLLALAHHCNARVVLPVLFYLCALVDERLYENIYASHVPPHVFQIIREGGKKLRTGTWEVIDRGSRKRTSGQDCSSKSCKARRGYYYVAEYYKFCRTPFDDDDNKSKDVRYFCANCKYAAFSRISCVPGELWEKLPSFFDLPEWNVLKAEVDSESADEFN